jgi:predicted acylesterase/phospholipase RssA
MIEHLVLSGAGINGLIQIGLLDYLIEHEMVHLNNIKSIYSTSAGSIISILIILGIPIKDIRDYIIHRPWEKFFNFDFLNLTNSNGIISSDHLYTMIKPFLMAYDIPDTFTLLDLYNKTNIDLHIFTTKLNDMSSVDLNYITFPDITLCEAITMTACVPIIFTPVYYKNEFYIDGGLLNNCPIQSIIMDNPDTILIIDIIVNIQEYTHNTPFINYVNIMFLKALNILCLNESNKTYLIKCKHYYQIKTDTMFDIEYWNNTFSSTERQNLYNIGYTYLKN